MDERIGFGLYQSCGGVLDVCLGCGGVGGEWVGLGTGLTEWGGVMSV